MRWVSENTRPFSIISDHGFKSLMKTGRPEYYLLSLSTVAHDVRHVFARSRQLISAFLRVCEPLYLTIEHMSLLPSILSTVVNLWH